MNFLTLNSFSQRKYKHVTKEQTFHYANSLIYTNPQTNPLVVEHQPFLKASWVFLLLSDCREIREMMHWHDCLIYGNPKANPSVSSAYFCLRILWHTSQCFLVLITIRAKLKMFFFEPTTFIRDIWHAFLLLEAMIFTLGEWCSCRTAVVAHRWV